MKHTNRRLILERRKKPHKTTLQWTRQMIRQVCKWVGKQRRLILVGDGGFASGQLAWDCIRLGVTLVSRLKMNARLFGFPPERKPGKKGRIAMKGRRLVNFKQWRLSANGQTKRLPDQRLYC